MTPQEAVARMHDRLRSWRAVADVCKARGVDHPGSYYRKVALGLIHKPSRDALCAIAAASSALLGVNITAVTSPRRRAARKNVSVSLDVALGSNRRKPPAAT